MAKRDTVNHTMEYLAMYNEWVFRATGKQIAESDVWYKQVHDWSERTALRYKRPLPAICAMISVLSPGNHWEQNIRDVESVLSWADGGQQGEVRTTVYKVQQWKAVKIALDRNWTRQDQEYLPMIGKEETARKTINFFWNILYPESPDYTTIDRHMKRAAKYRPDVALSQEEIRDSAPSPREYAEMRAACELGAKEWGILPNQYQARVWTAYRDMLLARERMARSMAA